MLLKLLLRCESLFQKLKFSFKVVCGVLVLVTVCENRSRANRSARSPVNRSEIWRFWYLDVSSKKQTAVDLWLSGSLSLCVATHLPVYRLL